MKDVLNPLLLKEFLCLLRKSLKRRENTILTEMQKMKNDSPLVGY